MLEDKENFNMFQSLNTFITCERNLNMTLVNQINKNILNTTALCHLFTGTININIFCNHLVKMTKFYSNYLDSFFANVKETIMCESCKGEISEISENSKRCSCLSYEDEYENDSREDSFEAENNSIVSIFNKMLDSFDEIYQKENLFYNYLNISVELPVFNELKYKYVHIIKLVLKRYINNLLKSFKQNYYITDGNCVINRNYINLMLNLKIYEIYEETLKQYLKAEIVKKIEELAFVHDKPVLNDVIKIFKDLFLNWANLNLKENWNLLKDHFEMFIKKSFLRIKTEYFFDVVTNYPESHATLLDLRTCLESCKSEVNIFKLPIY